MNAFSLNSRSGNTASAYLHDMNPHYSSEDFPIQRLDHPLLDNYIYLFVPANVPNV